MRRALLLAGPLLALACAPAAPPAAPMTPPAVHAQPPEPTVGESAPAPPEEKPDGCAPSREAAEAADTAENQDALGACEEAAGKLVAALRAYQRALELNLRARNVNGMRPEREKVSSLLKRVPHVSFKVPAAGEVGLQVWFDGNPVAALDKRFSVEPGAHHVRATAQRNGRGVTYDGVVQIKEAETLDVPLELR